MTTPKTSRLRHTTTETGDAQVTPLRDVWPATIDLLRPLLESSLSDEIQVSIPRSNYWFRAAEQEGGRVLEASVGSSLVGTEPLVTMSVRPPRRNNAVADLTVSIALLLEAVATGGPAESVTLNTLVPEFADLERCLAWTWLRMRGYC